MPTQKYAQCNEGGTALQPKPETVNAGSSEIFQYPLLHMTGHGNVVFSEEEAENLRTYLLGGGFLHIDDNPAEISDLKINIPKITSILLPKNEIIKERRNKNSTCHNRCTSRRQYNGSF